ncbi:hypothetical protein Poli38472_002907 [Pythium oligandrum]|uniref:Cyclic nucleotide-binding domain-containing protein n=1 Tax=Pythium oligandrum TaxID=41045 RepID=A0A8K1C6L0_PYTOL|nr:hypothetical protein Poli38472_002907 [Pythium oligandrum]|eukprot:TMW56982.1 hypothetical protein Poli38472_002907 [Pythium oligandrum]
MTTVLPRVAFFCCVFTAQCCVTVLGNISRDTIFLRSYKASSLSSVTLLLSFTTAYVLTRVNAFLLRLAQAQRVSLGVVYALAPTLLGVGLLVLALVSLGMPWLAKVTAVVTYIWIEITAQLLTGQFWDLCAKAFDVSQSKKYFGFITFGSTFGTLVASLLVLPFLQERQLPTECNLIASAVFLFAMALVLFFTADLFANADVVTSKSTTATGNHDGKTSPKASPTTSVLSEIKLRTYVQHICFFDLLATAMRVLIDNTTLTILSLQDEQQVKASLAQINSFQSLLMIPMQLASGPFFTHFGVMHGIGLLPVSIFVFGAATSTSTALFPLVLSRAFYNATSLAVFNPARELLWLPFSANERARFKSFVAGPFRSVSRIVGAVLSMVLTTTLAIQLFGPSCMSVLMMTFSLAWVVDAMAARKSYAAEFYASLKRGYLDLSSPLVDFTPDQLLLIKDTLRSGAQDQVNYVLSSLTDEHIGLFSQELRDLYHRRNEENESKTPFHTKLRLLTLHSTAKRRYYQQTQDGLFQLDISQAPGIFNAMDLLMIIKEKSEFVPRQLRVAAILACGYERLKDDSEQCANILRQLMNNKDEDTSTVVCAAVALLQLSDWMDEEANVILQRMIHEDRDQESRVTCLKVVGKELPEMLSDGYLVYLLNNSSPQILQAAVECCSTSARNSRMLIPPLMKNLTNSILRPQIVAALRWFDPNAVMVALSQYMKSSLQLETNGPLNPAHAHLDRREALSGALKVIEGMDFSLEEKLDLLLHLVSELVVTPCSEEQLSSPQRNGDILFRLFGRDSLVEELVVDSLVSLVIGMDKKLLQSHSRQLEILHDALSLKIREAHEMRHVLTLFQEICPQTAANIEETSPLLLQHIEHTYKDTVRILLKMLSTGFPKEFDVSVILEGLRSDVKQAHAAIQEVLESLLPSAYKNLVLPLLFPNATSSKAMAKINADIKERLGGRSGVDLLLDTMKCKKQHVELSCLALQYFLHVAEEHANFVDVPRTTVFEKDILPGLLQNDLARELLTETLHRRPQVLPYDSLEELVMMDPPLISKVAISNCLRISSLFENVCAIGILRLLSHHFVPMTVSKGQTFVKEGDLAAAMYVIAEGSVQLHKERRILAEVGYGTCVGQAALLRHSLHEGSHIASATALTGCVLLSVARSDLDALITATPRVSRGVLNAVASSLRSLYFEPLNTISQSGSLPSRDRRSSIILSITSAPDEAEHVLKRTESMTSSIKAAMSVGRATKSFLYNIGRSRTSEALAPTSTPGRRQRIHSFQGSVAHLLPRRSEVLPVRGLLSTSDGSDYSNFEKSIHLKGSQLMKYLDDDKVSLVAKLTKVLNFEHGDVLYTDGAPALHVYVVVNGMVSVQSKDDTTELRHGECFGEESFVEGTTMHGQASSVGRSTIFQIPTKDLIDLSEMHPDLLHVILAWLAQKLAKATETMVAPLLSPSGPPPSGDPWSSDEESYSESTLTNRVHKWRAETD